jgi:hypothetical protein
MQSQEYMGRGVLFERLTSQLNGNKDFAEALLVKRGDMINGEYTYKGAKLNAMDAPERAIARAGGGIYDAITNTAK